MAELLSTRALGKASAGDTKEQHVGVVGVVMGTTITAVHGLPQRGKGLSAATS